MKIASFLLAILSVAYLAGCSAQAEPKSASSGSTVSTEMAKCDACGKEVAKSELTSHEGQMMCKDCLSAHSN